MTVAILLMGGKGTRFQSENPKQFHMLSGQPIYLYTLKALQTSKLFDLIILVCPHDQKEKLEAFHATETEPKIKIVAGGKTRQMSSYLGLKAAPKNTKLVLIHDAIRPFVSEKILKQNIELAKKHKAVDTCLPSFDTIVHSLDGKMIEAIPLRQEYLRGQTPQTFSYPLILKAHKFAKKNKIENASDDCRLVLQMQHKIAIAQGDENNIKITTPLDLFLAEQILRLRTLSFSSPLKNKNLLNGKKYIVIGASGGIGLALKNGLQQAGAQIFPVSRSSQFFADLTKPASLKKSLSQILKEAGPADGLINLAGVLKIASLKELSAKQIEDMIKINLTGLILACKYAAIKKGGHIINIASSSYAKGRAFFPVYSAAKAAVVNFTQALAEENQDLKINVVVPSRTNTPMRRQNFPQEDLSLLLPPEKVAETIIALLKEEEITGSIIEVKN